MIQNKTARRIMYAWHNGQCSSFYAAASSGLVESFDSLLSEADFNLKHDTSTDMIKLIQWIKYKKEKLKTTVFVHNSYYFVLPWISRTHYK